MATSPEEVPRLEVLMERGLKNEVKDLKMVGPDVIKEIEPNCVVSMDFCIFDFVQIYDNSYLLVNMVQETCRGQSKQIIYG